MDDIPILVGATSEGKLVTLIDCRVLKASGIPGLFKTTQEITPLIIVYDVHFASVDEFRLKSLRMRYTNLDQWVASSGFRIEFSPEKHDSVTVHYAQPAPIIATLSNGLEVGVRFSTNGPNFAPSQSDIHIQQQAWLDVSAPDERTYDEFVRVLTMFADLIALCVGQPIRPIESHATASESGVASNEQKWIPFKILHNGQPIAPLLPEVASPEMLFRLQDLRSDFANVLERWCVQQKNIKPLYDLYFGTLRRRSMYVEHRFVNMFQALEAFDRRDNLPTPEKLERHQHWKDTNRG